MFAAQLTIAAMVSLAGALNVLAGLLWHQDPFFGLFGGLLFFAGIILGRHSLNIRGAQRFLDRHGLRTAPSTKHA